MRPAAFAALLWAVPLRAAPSAPSPACRPDRPGSGTLWRIVSDCLAPEVPDYCSRCPSPLPGTCEGASGCRETTEVWERDLRFVAIRDIKMCARGCPAGFVHGLALPRERVCGAEDPRRPGGIWSFAWSAAKRRIPGEEGILLAVNPRGLRSQNQLHVHILRLNADGRRRLRALGPAVLADLDDAWRAAERHARGAGLSGPYGVAVARAEGGGGFLVAAVAGRPERELGDAVCP